jgi:hypothetical protein
VFGKKNKGMSDVRPMKPVQVHSIPFRMKSMGKNKVSDDPKKCSKWEFKQCGAGTGGGGSSSEETTKISTSTMKNSAVATATSPRPDGDSRRRRDADEDVSTSSKELMKLCVNWERDIYGFVLFFVEEEQVTQQPKPDSDEEDCGAWKEILKSSVCSEPEKVAKRGEPSTSMINVPQCLGGWPCFLTGIGKTNTPKNSTSSSAKWVKTKDCNCDWPCVPFFEAFNRCYDTTGAVLVDDKGRNVILYSKVIPHKVEPFIKCSAFVEKNEIKCSIKGN